MVPEGGVVWTRLIPTDSDMLDAVPGINRKRLDVLSFVVESILHAFHLIGFVLGIVQTIEKLQKKCIIKFTKKEMHIICNSDANEGGIQVWS
jgi:hypothetical protein